MASTYESRDNPNSGTEPTVPLGYPAVVRYTFTPQTTEFNELFVSEGDIVQLLYSVGGWVYVKTYTGNTGYIPIQYCLTLDSSKRLSTQFDDIGSDANQLVVDAGDRQSLPEERTGSVLKRLEKSEKYGKLFSEQPADYVQRLEQHHPPKYSVRPTTTNSQYNGYVKVKSTSGQIPLECNNITKRPPTFPPGFDPKLKQNNIGTLLSDNNLNGQTIPESTANGTYCRFLSQIVLAIQNLAITDREKADFKSGKLLKILKLASKESSNLISLIRPAIERDKIYYADINNTQGIIIENTLRNKCELTNQCPYCHILKEYLKATGEISMSDLYSTIRNLHLHALSDSDSDQEGALNPNSPCGTGGHQKHGAVSDNESSFTRTNGCLNWTANDSLKNGLRNKRSSDSSVTPMKRSVSFQLQDKKEPKPELTRNRSFSGGSVSDDIKNGGNQFIHNGNHIMNGFVGNVPSKRPNAPPAYDQVFISECECPNSDSKEANNNHQKHFSFHDDNKNIIRNGDDSEISDRLSSSDFPSSPDSFQSHNSSKSDHGSCQKNNRFAKSALDLLNSQAKIYERTKQTFNEGNSSFSSNSSESIHHVQNGNDVRDAQTGISSNQVQSGSGNRTLPIPRMSSDQKQQHNNDSLGVNNRNYTNYDSVQESRTGQQQNIDDAHKLQEKNSVSKNYLCSSDRTVRNVMPVQEKHCRPQENNNVSNSTFNSNEVLRDTKPIQERQFVSKDQSHTDRQPAMFSKKSLSSQGAKPKQFHQLNFYGLASLSNNSNISSSSTAEPEMPSESQKYATWGGRLDKKKIIARRLQIPGTPKDNGNYIAIVNVYILLP